jgi:acyl-[acyl-carrier-protein] desaturase
MPGSIIPGFTRKAVAIAKAGIYDLRIHHDDVVMPLLRQWKVFELEGLGPEGEKARQELEDSLSALDAAASRFVEQREAAEAKRQARLQSARS